MGFRFTLESANTVANLTCGRVYSCYDGIYDSYENFEGFLYFLDNFSENMYSNRGEYLRRNVHDIQRTIREIGYLENRVDSDFKNEYREGGFCMN